MDEMQGEFERIVNEAREAGNILTDKQLSRVAQRVVRRTGAAIYRTLNQTASDMLTERRTLRDGFEERNFRRWRKAFDLMETIWVSCEELGAAFNDHCRPQAVEEKDYVFEAMTHLHAKALLVTSEIICLLRGGFADGALTRWRTLFETNVVATLIRQEGQELALRYLAHSHVQTWNRVRNQDEKDNEYEYIRARAEFAIEKFGDELSRRNGWACAITGQKYPTFEKLVELANRGYAKSLYERASLHVHSNHRPLDDLLGMCEAQDNVFLVGPSNSGMVAPLILTSLSIAEATSLHLLVKPNLDRIILVDTIWRMANRMEKLSRSIERRTFEAAKKQKR